MKHALCLLLICLFLTGCTVSAPAETTAATEPPESPNLMLANPWVSYDSMKEAEESVGFSFALPEIVEGSFHAESFRVMNGQLMEVLYRDQEDPRFEVTVRQAPGMDQDISGDYRSYEESTVTKLDTAEITCKRTGKEYLYLVSCNGYSFSMYAPNGFRSDSCNGFGRYLLGEVTK